MKNPDFIYKAYDLDGHLLHIAESQPDLCRKLGVSESVIQARLNRKITKYDHARGDKYKFNVVKYKYDEVFSIQNIRKGLN